MLRSSTWPAAEERNGRITGRSARLSDVAERAGVSKATASNVFNRPNLVREEVRARVLAEAKAIGYAGPDPKGRLLSAGKVNAIGVATAEPLAYFFEDPFARAMMVGITEACDANGIGISLVSAASEDALAWSIKSALVDGLILFCLEDADRLVEAARERRLPFVALAFGDTDESVSVVGRRRRGRRAAGRAAPGRARPSPLRGPRHGVRRGQFGPGDAWSGCEAADYATSRERVTGYFEALAAFGIDTGQRADLRDDRGPGDHRCGARGDLRRRPSRRPRSSRSPTGSPCGRSTGSGTAGSPCRATSR